MNGRPGVDYKTLIYNTRIMHHFELTADVAANRLGCCPTHVRRLVHRGIIAATRMPPRGRLRISRESVAALLNSLRKPAKGPQ